MADAKRVVIFGFYSMGLGARKANIVFWAERLAAIGWQTDVVTVQFSWMTALANKQRMVTIPPDARNCWRVLSPTLSNYVWVAPAHPFSTNSAIVNTVTRPLCTLYPAFMPSQVCDRVADADLVVIESTVAVTLFNKVKQLNPKAKVVYAASDPLEAVGMHPHLSTLLQRDAPYYDLVTVFSPQLLEGFGEDVNAIYIPQAIEKSLFHAGAPSPFERPGPHAVIAGDMMFDAQTVGFWSEAFPDMSIHVFGCKSLGDLADRPNIIDHGEAPFEILRDYLLHADIGIAPYLDRADLHYLAQSGMKLHQYTYAQLPIVAPYFCVGDRNNVCEYRPGDRESAVEAMTRALQFDRASIDRSGVLDWSEAVDRMLTAVRNSPPRPALPARSSLTGLPPRAQERRTKRQSRSQ